MIRYLALTVATLALAANAQASYLITVAVTGASNPSPINTANASGVPSTVSSYDSSLSTSVSSGLNESNLRLNPLGGPVTSPVLTSIQTSSPYGSIYSSLSSSFTVFNQILEGTGVTIPTVTITISQSAYSFSGVQNNLFTDFTATAGGTYAFTPGAESLVTQTASAGASSITTSTVSLGASGSSGSVFSRGSFAGGAPNSTSIVQTFTITNFKPGQSITFSSLTGVSTPLPASALAFGAGLPLLGLAGFVRRRLFA